MMGEIYNGLLDPQEALDTVRYALNEGNYEDYTEGELKALEALISTYMIDQINQTANCYYKEI